jgi:uncharacterized protein YndB with AHSA1/START domain
MTEKPSEKCVYVTYIQAAPQKIWDAITKSEITKQYWVNNCNVSDWKPGSSWRHEDYDTKKLFIVGKVVEVMPPKRLVVTWASPADADNEAKHSRVTFEIEPHDGGAKLTVTHDNLEPDSEMLRGISRGWPFVLSNLKSFLENGRVMKKAWPKE